MAYASMVARRMAMTSFDLLDTQAGGLDDNYGCGGNIWVLSEILGSRYRIHNDTEKKINQLLPDKRI